MTPNTKHYLKVGGVVLLGAVAVYLWYSRRVIAANDAAVTSSYAGLTGYLQTQGLYGGAAPEQAGFIALNPADETAAQNPTTTTQAVATTVPPPVESLTTNLGGSGTIIPQGNFANTPQGEGDIPVTYTPNTPTAPSSATPSCGPGYAPNGGGCSLIDFAGQVMPIGAQPPGGTPTGGNSNSVGVAAA